MFFAESKNTCVTIACVLYIIRAKQEFFIVGTVYRYCCSSTTETFSAIGIEVIWESITWLVITSSPHIVGKAKLCSTSFARTLNIYPTGICPADKTCGKLCSGFCLEQAVLSVRAFYHYTKVSKEGVFHVEVYPVYIVNRSYCLTFIENIEMQAGVVTSVVTIGKEGCTCNYRRLNTRPRLHMRFTRHCYLCTRAY